MRRLPAILAICLLGSGCAVQPAAQQAKAPSSRPVPVPALALAIDPPITLGQPPIDLARADRASCAFGSYQGLMTTYFSIHTIDRQTNDDTDRYERRTDMDRVGASYR